MTTPIDLDAVWSRLRLGTDVWRPNTDVQNLREMGGGSSSLTLAATLVGATEEHLEVVIKVAPAGVLPTQNRDVLRQAAIMRRLREESSIPVPTVLFDDPGKPPDVPPLFVMEAVSGDSVEPLIDEADSLPSPEHLTGRGLEAARVLASLHALHPSTLGLEDEPVVSLDDEVTRWERILQSSRIDLGDLPERCLSALRSQMPSAVGPTLVHGDFRLGNQICCGPRVRAVIDWEIWTVSDPRIDLGWFLMTFQADKLPSAKRSSAPGLPHVDALLEAYETSGGESVEDLRWFSALAQLRSASAMALNVKHNRRRSVPSPRIESYAALLPQYLRGAIDLIGS